MAHLRCGNIIPFQGYVLGGRALRVSPGCAQRSPPPPPRVTHLGKVSPDTHNTQHQQHSTQHNTLLSFVGPKAPCHDQGPHLVGSLYSATSGPVCATDGHSSTLHLLVPATVGHNVGFPQCGTPVVMASSGFVADHGCPHILRTISDRESQPCAALEHLPQPVSWPTCASPSRRSGCLTSATCLGVHKEALSR